MHQNIVVDYVISLSEFVLTQILARLFPQEIHFEELINVLAEHYGWDGVLLHGKLYTIFINKEAEGREKSVHCYDYND